MSAKSIAWIFLLFFLDCFCLIFFAPYFNARIHYCLELCYLLGGFIVIVFLWGMRLLEKNIMREGELLSGAYVAIHKFFIPLALLACLLADSLLLILRWFRADILPLYIIVEPALLFSLIWCVYDFFSVKTLYRTKKTLIFCDFFSSDYECLLSDIENVERVNANICRISIKGKQHLEYKVFVPILPNIFWRNENTKFYQFFHGRNFKK